MQAFRLMVYCLYGDCHTLDDKLREIMRKLGLEEENNPERKEEAQTKQAKSTRNQSKK